jgi:hypothetical protein
MRAALPDDALLLTSGGQEHERVALVSGRRAIRLRTEGGYELLPLSQSLRLFDGGSWHQRPWEFRRFVSHCRIGGTALRDLRDWEILRIVRQAIQGRELIGVRLGGLQTKEDRTAAEWRRWIRDIETQTRGRLTANGRHYRLVVDADLARVPNRNDYEVVGHDDAVGVLASLARQIGTSNDLAKSFAQASSALAHDWRPPFSPDGLVLLRKLLKLAATSTETGPAATPSQIAKLLTTIEIVLLDAEGEPVPGEVWDLLLPDGGKRSGQLDEDGHVSVTNIPPGSCCVSFPHLDEECWSLSRTRPL